MWERSARQNPLSFRYQTYKDNRPVLPQDPTNDWLQGRHSDYIIYYYIINGKSVVCSNNIPVHDRQLMENLTKFRTHFNNNLRFIGLIPTIFLSSMLFKRFKMPFKILYPVIFYALYKVNNALLRSYFGIYFSDNFSYFYHKYKHMAVNNFNAIKDPRRQHFKIDTSVYYRQSPEEVANSQHGHGGEDHGEAHHETSDYYGPYPYNDFENTDHLMEINRKFTTGNSRFDDKNHETLLGEHVDVNRFVPGLPTDEDYRNI